MKTRSTLEVHKDNMFVSILKSKGEKISVKIGDRWRCHDIGISFVILLE